MKRALISALAVTFAAGSAFAAGPAPNEVKYDEYGAVAESLTGVPGDPVKGAEVYGSKSIGNCVACHLVTELEERYPFHGEVGPALDGAGSRWTEAELRGIVANAKVMFEGTVMPAFYKKEGYIRPGKAYTGKAAAPEDLDTLLTAQQIEDVVAYLMTLKDE